MISLSGLDLQTSELRHWIACPVIQVDGCCESRVDS
jgi:hypothetical protein